MVGALDETTSDSLLATVEREQTRRAESEHPAASVASTERRAGPIIEAEAVDEPSAARESTSPTRPPPQAPPRPTEQPPPATVAQRAAAFAERQAAQPAAVAPPRRSWTDWLAAFMEERNMRWGELVGGLLIVCCSIALVISFWSEIEARPWLKFLLFNGVTAALFGVGFYSEHRWRLHTTSQGLLSIGCLLVPLNFLAIAALSNVPGSDQMLTIVGELVSAVIFAVLVYFAGKVLIRRDAVWLTAGLLAPALAQLLVRRFIEPGVALPVLWAMAAVPVGSYLAANLWHFRGVGARPVVGERVTNALFRFLGLTSFAVVLPLALLLYKSGAPIETLRQLPALAALLGCVPLAGGLLLWQRLAAGSLSGLRTAGASVAVFGAAVTLAGLVIGWPEPSGLLPAAVVDFLIFSFVAWRFGMPAAHLLAAPCLALAYLLAAHLAGGTIAFSGNGSQAMADALASGESGTLLAPLVLAYAGATLLARRRGMLAARAWAVATAGLMAASVALVTWYGFGYEGDPLGAGWVYLVYAALTLAAAARHRSRAIAWAGSVLLLAGTLEEVAFHFGAVWGLAQPTVTALLVYCTLGVVIGIVVARARLASGDSKLVDVCWRGSIYASLAAGSWLVWRVPLATAGVQAIHWSWLAAVWLASAIVVGWLPLWTLFQLALVAATVFGVVAGLSSQPWFAAARWPWLEPWTLQAIGLALVALSVAWTAVRLACRRAWSSPRLAPLLDTPWLSIDRLTTVALAGLLVLLSLYFALPGALVEISPADGRIASVADFEIPGIPQVHAGGWGSWALAAGLTVVLLLMLRERTSRVWLAALITVTATSVPLAAGWFESSRAVATALAWLSIAFLLVGSVKIWAARLASAADRAAGLAVAGCRRRGLARRDGAGAVLRIVGAGGAGDDDRRASRRSHDARGADGRSGGAAVCRGRGHRDRRGDVVPAGGCRCEALAHERTGPPRYRHWLCCWRVVPALAIGVYWVAGALVASPPVGPDAQSIFARAGWPAAYGGPTLVVAAVLVGYALRERSGRYALAGGLTLNVAATLINLLTSPYALTDAALWIRLAQLNAAVAAGYTLAWIGVAAVDRRRGTRLGYAAAGPYFRVQSMLAPAILTLAVGWAWTELVTHPVSYPFGPPVLAELADVAGCLSLVLVSLAAVAAARATGGMVSRLGISGLLVALAMLAAGIAARWDAANWLAYNTLYVGHAIVAAGLLALAWRETRERPRGSSTLGEEPAVAPRGAMWPLVQIGIVVSLALREVSDDVWWTVGGLAVAGVALTPALAWTFQRRRYLYLAVPLVNLAGLLAANQLGWIPDTWEFVDWNIVLLAAAGGGLAGHRVVRHRTTRVQTDHRRAARASDGDATGGGATRLGRGQRAGGDALGHGWRHPYWGSIGWPWPRRSWRPSPACGMPGARRDRPAVRIGTGRLRNAAAPAATAARLAAVDRHDRAGRVCLVDELSVEPAAGRDGRRGQRCACPWSGKGSWRAWCGWCRSTRC